MKEFVTTSIFNLNRMGCFTNLLDAIYEIIITNLSKFDVQYHSMKEKIIYIIHFNDFYITTKPFLKTYLLQNCGLRLKHQRM